MFQFKKAEKTQSKLRLSLIGPSGSGKTYSALAVATRLGKRVAVIDTERGSASKYAGDFDFDVLELESFAPDMYVKAIHAAEAAGYDVIVVDSLSHAWMGKDGALEQVDHAAKQSRSGNSFTAWRDVTPMHNRMVDALVSCRAHLICTMRAKTEYVLSKDDRGKSTVEKMGMAAVQRDGLEYEFDVVGDMTLKNDMIVSKTRISELHGKVIPRPGKDLAEMLLNWLTDGAAVPERPLPGAWVEAHEKALANCETIEQIITVLDSARRAYKPNHGTQADADRITAAETAARQRVSAEAAQ